VPAYDRVQVKGSGRVENDLGAGGGAGVPFSALVEPPVPAVQAVRSGEGPTVHSEQAGHTATLLSASPPGARRDIYQVWLESDGVRDSEPHIPGIVEHIVVVRGG
jgi:hypothetical protein